MIQRHYTSAAAFAGLSAVLHLVALPLGGFATAIVPAILGAAIWALVARHRGYRHGYGQASW